MRLLVREALHEEGHHYLGNIAELPYLLTPLLAKSALQQDFLHRLFADFLLDCEREAERLETEPIPPPPLPPVQPPPVPPFWKANWIWGVAALVLMAGVYLIIQSLKPPPELFFPFPDTAVRIGDTVVFKNLSEGFPDKDEDFRWEVSRVDEVDFISRDTTRDFTWVVQEQTPTLVGQEVRVVLRREGLEGFSDTLKVQCGDPPIIRQIKTPEPPLEEGKAYTIEVVTDPDVRVEWTIDGKQYDATPSSGSDTLHSLTYTFAQAGEFFASFIAYRPGARVDCFVEWDDLRFFAGKNKPILPTKSLRMDEPTLILSLANWVHWLMLLIIMCAGCLFWLADFQKIKRPERPAKSDTQLIDEHPIHDEAPYYVPYLDRNGLIQVPPDFFRMADVMRRREEGERSNFDALSSVQATIQGGGFPQLLEAADTLPGDYLILVARSNARHQQGRLWERLTSFWKKQDAPVEIWCHDGSFRSFWQEKMPEVQGLQQLRRRFPQHRLVLLGTGEGLLNPYDTRSPSLHTDLAATLQQWPRRLLLTPAPPAGWSYREKLLYRYTLLYPADTRGILEGLEALDALEEFEPGAYSTHETAQQTRRSHLHDRYRDWSSLQAHRDYLEDDPEALRWLCGLAVSAAPDWSLTLAIGRALGVSVTHDRLLALTRIPWLAANEDHTELRLQLIAQLTPAEEQAARQAAAEELEDVREKVAGSFAEIEWKTNLAVQYFALDPRDEAHKNLIRDLQQAGLLTGSQLEELDFIVRERIKQEEDLPASAYISLVAWLDAALIAPYWNKWMKMALVMTVLWLTISVLASEYTADKIKSAAHNRGHAIWETTKVIEDYAVSWHNQAVGIGQRMRTVEHYDAWKIMQRDSMQIGDSLFVQARNLRGSYALADTNQLILRYNFAAQRFNYRFADGIYQVMDTVIYQQTVLLSNDAPKTASLIAWQENAKEFAEVNTLANELRIPPLLDALHGRGLCYYYCSLEAPEVTIFCDSANAIYQQLLESTNGQYFVALADTIPINLESLLLEAACTTGTATLTELITIGGRIVDEKTGEPIANATLRVAQADRITEAQLSAGRDADIRSTTSDAQGRYTLTGLPSRTQLQRYATATGYESLNSRASATLLWGDMPLKATVSTSSDEAKTAYEAALENIANNMVRVPSGTFTMGCQEGRDTDCIDYEKPAHEVTLSSFSISKYEVTQAQWRAVMGSDPPELYNKGCDQCPVENVSWNDIQKFLQKLNAQTGQSYRLPTEAEWEYAARGGNKSQGYLYSGSNDIMEVAWHDANYEEGNTHGSKKTTRPVGGKKPNELGVYDMSGNVYEWCSDWFGDYPSSAQQNPSRSEPGLYRVDRGGGWSGNSADCRSADRGRSSPTIRYNPVGFRLARSF